MDINEIARKISDKNGRLYLVGGAVRDELLANKSHDNDYAVVGISAQDFQTLLPTAKLRGKDFPVFDIDGTEFALARKERKTAKGHKGFEIFTSKEINIEEDLSRRDITINSMAIDVLTGKIIDPFGGIKDLENKIIRATSEAFLEDPLRSYRAARFTAKLDFNIDEYTKELMTKTKNELKTLSVERIFDELRKALLTNKPSNFFDSLKNTNLLSEHFQEIESLINVEQPKKYHPEGDVYNHTMIVIDKVANATDNPVIIFASLVHDFGKADTPIEEWPKHIGHEKKGVEHVINLCNRLKMPTIYKKAGIISCLEHMKAGIYNNMRYATKVDFLVRNSKTVLGLKGLEIIANADNSENKRIKFAEIGERMIKEVNAREYPADLLPNQIIERLRQDRIEWLKKNEAI